MTRKTEGGAEQDRDAAPRVPQTRVHVELDALQSELPSTPPAREATLARAFVLDRELGQGGMGQVLAARDVRLGRSVAIKVLHDELKQDAQLRGRFLTEAQVGGQLEHPNIVPVYAFELTTDGSPAFVMQLVSGSTLEDYIEAARDAPDAERDAGGRYALKERLSKLLSVCDAIGYAHERGVIHRDLKPANVMLGQHNEVLVMDWGIAHLLDTREAPATVTLDEIVFDDAADPLAGTAHDPATGPAPRSDRVRTRTGAVIGTPQYMSPEQALGGVVTESTDQYALGLMAYELAALRPARRHDSTREAYTQAVIGTYAEHVDHEGRAFDARLSAILARATHIVPASRYPSVAALARDLAAFVRDEEVSALPDGAARKVVRVMQRHPTASVASVMSLLLVLAALAIFSLWASAERARLGRDDARTIARLTSLVARRSRAIDTELHDLEASVVALGTAVRERLELAPEDPSATWLTSSDFDAGRVSEVVPSPLDGGPRSYVRPVFALAPESAPSATSEARRLAGMDDVFSALVLRTVTADSATVVASSRAVTLASARHGLVRLGLALDDGFFAQFPGRGGFSTDFDARRTDWYRHAITDAGPRVTRPKYGPLGRTVRIAITTPFFRDDVVVGALVGEVLLDHVVALLDIPSEPGLRRAFVACTDGFEVASRALLDAATARGGEPEASVTLQPIASATLARALSSGADAGFVVDGDTLYVYDRTTIEDWWLVAEFEYARYLSLAD